MKKSIKKTLRLSCSMDSHIIHCLGQQMKRMCKLRRNRNWLQYIEYKYPPTSIYILNKYPAISTQQCLVEELVWAPGDQGRERLQAHWSFLSLHCITSPQQHRYSINIYSVSKSSINYCQHHQLINLESIRQSLHGVCIFFNILKMLATLDYVFTIPQALY